MPVIHCRSVAEARRSRLMVGSVTLKTVLSSISTGKTRPSPSMAGQASRSVRTRGGALTVMDAISPLLERRSTVE